MTTKNQTPKIHPLAAAAAIAVIVVCLVGVAAMLGILPNFNKSAPPVASTETVGASAPVSAVAVAPPPPTPEPVVEEKPAPAPKVVQKKPPVKKPVRTASSTRNTNPDNPYQSSPPPCSNCGVVESVRPVEHEGSSSGIGAGVGAVVGGLLGNQVGGGNGRTLATIAGAVGGGYAGNEIEKRRSSTTTYEVIVRMDNGGRQRFMMREQRWASGDLVRVVNGTLVAR